MWAKSAEGGWRLGFSAYAVRLIGDLRHLEWSVAEGARLEAGQQIGFVEGSKATSDLYAPTAGTLVETNRRVLADPTLINSNLYDAGWLLMISDMDNSFLSPKEYLVHLEASWPLAQRLLKGQAGRR
jgi:glycine cleavage system H protein